MLRFVTAASLTAVLLASTGCATTKVSLRDGPREYVATDYELVLDTWTRTENLITLAQLDNLLTATATFESWDFRWAYIVRYVEDYRLNLDQRMKLLDQTLDETKTSHHFFVAITGGKRRYNDLTKPDSAWIVRLIDSEGNETVPAEIILVKRPNAVERTYFPYLTPFHQVFRIRFPMVKSDGRAAISPRAEWFGLRFAGAQGNSELVWALEREEEEQVFAPSLSPDTETAPSTSAPAATEALSPATSRAATALPAAPAR